MVAPTRVHKNPRIDGFSQEARNSKPVALVVYPEADHNGAFSKIKAQTYDFKKHGYNVVYVKCAKDQDLFDAIRRVGGEHKISVLYIGGHGAAEDTQFGKGSDESNFLDVDDVSKMAGLDQYLTKQAVVILDSCSTGSGGEDRPISVANTLGRVFPGKRIYAPRFGVSRFPKINFSGGGQIVDVKFSRVIRGFPETIGEFHFSTYTYFRPNSAYTYVVPKPELAHNKLLARHLKGENITRENITHPVTFGSEMIMGNGVGLALGGSIRDVLKFKGGAVDVGAKVSLGMSSSDIVPGIDVAYRFPLMGGGGSFYEFLKLHGGITAVSSSEKSKVGALESAATVGIEKSWNSIILQLGAGAQCVSNPNGHEAHRCGAVFTFSAQAEGARLFW